jgi:UTP--glucose-1-phosphate uridylyltransferase
MKVRRALITAAAPNQHTLPLQQLVDSNGESKTALQLILEEVVRAGVEEICVVIQPGDQEEYRRAAGPEVERLLFVEQPRPQGYGHALLQARDFVGRDPFLHLVGDHLYLSQHDRCCAQQLIEAAAKHGCSVSAVQATRETKLPYFGAVGGQLIRGETNLYEVTKVLEKPTPTLAEQELIIAGLRAGYYLCFFGMHVLTPGIMDILADMKAATNEVVLSTAKASDKPRQLQLSSALAQLAQQEKYLALELDGTRYNIGVKYGLLMAQLALALQGHDRDAILTELVELLATGSISRN